MQINLAIAHLLLRHNCVIIPSFGGFVANVRTAQINLQKGVITPPKKVLTFNANLVNNDGLLANYLSKTEAISFDEANASVSTICEAWKKDLSAGKRVEIEKVGFLYLDYEGNLNFEQNRFFNLLLSSFGLENVHFIAEEPEKTVVSTNTISEKVSELQVSTRTVELAEKKRVTFAEKDTKPKEKVDVTPIVNLNSQKKKRNFWKIAAAAVFLPIAFYTFWIPMRTDVLQSGILLSRDFNPFEHKTAAKYQLASPNLDIEALQVVTLEQQVSKLPKEVDLFAYHLDEYKYVQLKLRENKNLNKSKSAKKINKQTAPFQIITGCFGNKTNALSLIDQLTATGFSAYILDQHKGLYRVAADGANTIEKTNPIKTKLKSLGFESWVLSL